MVFVPRNRLFIHARKHFHLISAAFTIYLGHPCKVAGAAADAGLSLAGSAEVKHVSEVVGTMGVALSVFTLPGQVTSDRLGPKQLELGLGIHGEPGVAVVDLQPVDIVVEHILKQILSQETQYLPITRGSSAVLLINGLGASPIMELMIATRKAVSQLQLEYGIATDTVYVSFDMEGFSISIMKSDTRILQHLDASIKALYWPVRSDELVCIGIQRHDFMVDIIKRSEKRRASCPVSASASRLQPRASPSVLHPAFRLLP